MAFPMNELEQAYRGSDADRTRALYQRLIEHGQIGDVAINLLRACKASERAKEYRGRYVRAAYDKKDWSLDQLCGALDVHAADLGIRWGWGRDEKAVNFENVLYCDLPDNHGQVNFHCARRMVGPDYSGDWDGVKGEGANRIIAFATAVLAGEALEEEQHAAQPDRTEASTATPSTGTTDSEGEQKAFGF